MTTNFRKISASRAALAALAASAALLDGCGGTSQTGSAFVRAVNTVGDGGAAVVLINGGSWTGDQTFFQASSYSGRPTGSTAFTFTLTNNLAGATYATNTQTLSSGHYSAIVMGRAADTTAGATGFPQILVTSDDTTLTAGSGALVRFINAAPDAGTADVLVNGGVVTTGEAYTTIGSYTQYAAGSLTAGFDATGTKNAIASAQTFTLTAGHQYSVYLLEGPTTSSTPSYSINILDDTH